MNVGQILDEVADELQHAPDVRDARRDRQNVLRKVHTDLCRMYRWPWLQREYPLILYPDLTIDTTTLSMLPGSVVNSERFILFDRSDLMDAGMGDDTNALARPAVLGALLDATVGLVDSTLGYATGWGLGPYLVDQVLDAQARAPAFPTDSVGIALEPRASVSFGGSEGNLTISWPRRMLQPDVGQILEVVDDQGRRLQPVTPAEFELLSRRSDNAGEPAFYTADQGFLPEFPPAHVGHLDAWAVADGAPNMSPYAHRNEPLRDEITASFVTGTSSSFEMGHTYRVFGCWLYQGRYGPPSNIVELRPTDATKLHLEVDNLPELPDGVAATPYPDYGWTLAFFVATDDGPYYLWIAAENNDLPYFSKADRTYTLLARQYATEPWKAIRWDQVYPGGRYGYLRFWPKPSAISKMTVRYRSRPSDLLGRNDEPWFADGFHDYLVYETTKRLVARSSSDALYNRMQQEAERVLAMMRRYYLVSEDKRHQRGRIDRAFDRVVPVMSVDWQGD